MPFASARAPPPATGPAALPRPPQPRWASPRAGSPRPGSGQHHLGLTWLCHNSCGHTDRKGRKPPGQGRGLELLAGALEAHAGFQGCLQTKYPGQGPLLGGLGSPPPELSGWCPRPSACPILLLEKRPKAVTSEWLVAAPLAPWGDDLWPLPHVPPMRRAGHARRPELESPAAGRAPRRIRTRAGPGGAPGGRGAGLVAAAPRRVEPDIAAGAALPVPAGGIPGGPAGPPASARGLPDPRLGAAPDPKMSGKSSGT